MRGAAGGLSIESPNRFAALGTEWDAEMDARSPHKADMRVWHVVTVGMSTDRKVVTLTPEKKHKSKKKKKKPNTLAFTVGTLDTVDTDRPVDSTGMVARQVESTFLQFAGGNGPTSDWRSVVSRLGPALQMIGTTLQGLSKAIK